MINFTFLSVSLFLNVSLHSSLVQLELSCLIPWGLNPQSSLKLFNNKNLFLFSFLLPSFTVSCFFSCDALILFFLSCFLHSHWALCEGMSGCACVSFCVCVCVILCSTIWACVWARVSGASISNFRSYLPLTVCLKEVFSSPLFSFSS